jgi:CzcA family heavy metal efflux pump
MLTRLIQWSLGHRPLVLGLSLLLLALGFDAALRLPVEVLPDLTKPTVTILTESPGLAPEEVEAQVTQPIENALMGVAGLTRLRSNSDVALSLIYAEFDWNTDIHRARVLVQERLQSARERLPEGTQPYLTPVASLMGEILLVGVRSTVPAGEPGHLAPAEVRTLADWTLRPRLQSIPGVAEVLNMGGGVRRLEVRPDPYRLQAYDVGLDELEAAVAAAAGTTTGGHLTTGPAEIMVRNLAMTTDPAAIGRTVVKVADGRPVTVAEVAEVTWSLEPMRGDATVSRPPEKEPTYGVIMSVTKAPGFDTRDLTARVNAALAELQPGLPTGVETLVLFQQKDFIDVAIGNLREAIRDGALMVVVVLYLFLLKIRTTVITLTAMPMSFALTLLVFRQLDVSVNAMTLGGLAVAIGMVVDDAIVDVENVFRRLRENAALPSPRPRLEVIAAASGEVRNSIFYATLLIVLAFVPLLGLSGLEGRLFAPIAVATMLSMAASFVVSLTLIPVLCSFLLRPKPGQVHGDGLVVRVLKGALRTTLLRLALDRPVPVLAVVVVGLVAALSLYPGMGKDFLPPFREQTALIAVTSAPGTSLPQMNRLADAIERQLLAVPEVKRIGRRLGRAERGDHVVPVSTAEFDVDFRFNDERGAEPPARPRDEVMADIAQRLRTVPGTFGVVSGPLADRIGHLMSGVAAPIAVKIYGPDLETLRRLGTEVRDVARTIPGLESATLDAQSFIPQIRIEPDRERTSSYGVAPGALNAHLGALVGGKPVAELREGARTVDLVLRLPPAWRETPEAIAALPVRTAAGPWVPVSALADVREARGPNVIHRENNQRRFIVAIKPSARDAATLAERLRDEVTARVSLPTGYFLAFEGEFQARADASRRILVLGTGVLLLTGVLLYGYFRSAFMAVQVLFNIPLALVGGLVFTWLKLDNISIATLVGFIAVGGIAARNGIMMLSHYLHLMRHEGEGFTRAMVERGTLERMVPVLMTALVAAIALIPLLLAGDEPGKEILHPVAVVIVGGLVSSTLLDFLVTPAVFHAFGRKAAEQALARGASAGQ